MMQNRYHHLSWLDGIELFEARLTVQTFSRHAHEGFAIGAIASGVGGYFCRGEHMVLPPGSLSLMNPEEMHTGRAHSEKLAYNMLYISQDAVCRRLGLRTLKGFREVTPKDHGLALVRALDGLSTALNAPDHPDRKLAIEESVDRALSTVFETHGRAQLRKPGRENQAIARVRAAIRAAVERGDEITLETLAGLVGLHPSYLIRSFRKATGLTPHAYAIQCRVERARAALVGGMGGAEAALHAGFYDQSHMIRNLKRQLGVTPGRIRVH
ncbi:MAG TPA: AraC family transcriptional regulator [Rhodobacterales bacterium]|nr:AraC family transcriptional regulator [Rhodobacterales bacterium]